MHPGLRHPHVITDPAEMVARAHGNRLLHVGHVAVLACCPLLIVIVIHYSPYSTSCTRLDGRSLALAGVRLRLFLEKIGRS